jgi:SAM-dependent methyltransferase
MPGITTIPTPVAKSGASVVRCPTCEGVCHYWSGAKDVNRRISDETFDYYRCPVCALIFLPVIPPDLGRFYTTSYYSIPISLDILKRRAEGQRFKIETVQRFTKKGRILEIGPAQGEFLFLAKAAGFSVEAIEMDQRCCEFISKVIGARVVQNEDVCMALSDLEQYDVITLWQSLEHLPNPWEVLASVSKHLNPGGLLFISTPNPDSFQFRMMGSWWPHLDAPRHLSLIPSSLLVNEARKRDLIQVSVSANDTESHVWDRFGWEFAAMNMLGHQPNAALGLKILRRGFRYAGTALSVSARLVERRGFRGSSYTVVFRRQG